MAEKIGMHVSQLKRYESGASQPTIEVLRRIVLALNVSADTLLLDECQPGPDESLKLQFEASSTWAAMITKPVDHDRRCA